MKGKVYIVGAGPGDPKLLTLKALEVLKNSDVVLYDRLVNPEILRLLKTGTRTIYVGKTKGEQEEKQEMILNLMEELVCEGYRVVRLKGGDPFVFGRGAEEVFYFLERNIEVEVVPGIPSCIAVPELAGIPLTFRGCSSAFAVVSGRKCKGEVQWSNYVNVDTLVILMGVENRDCIARELIKAGKSPEEPVAFVEKGTWKEERVIFSTLEKVAEGVVKVNPPAVFVIGKVVEIAKILKKSAEVVTC